MVNRSIPPDLLKKIKQIIEEITAIAKNKEKEELLAGKVLYDDPKACLVLSPTIVCPDFCEKINRQHEEFVTLWDGECKAPAPYLLRKGITSYLTARRTWGAYCSAKSLLEEAGFGESEIQYYMPQLFPYVYGCTTIVRYLSSAGSQILLGIRSQNLAGKDPGTVSFPGGLVDFGETLKTAAMREFVEEGGNEKIVFKPLVARGYFSDCPSVTFVHLAETNSQSLRESFEWNGRRAIWVPEEHLLGALNGDNSLLVHAFKENDIEIDDNLVIAPNVQKPARELLMDVYPLK